MERLGDLRTVALAIVLLVPAVNAGTSQATVEQLPDCPTIGYADRLGPACQQANGLIAVFDDEGNKLGTTHGPDPALSDSQGESGGFLSYPADHPTCDDEPPYFQVMFLHAQDTQGMTGEIRAEIVEEASRANGRLMEASEDTSLEFVVHCENGEMTIPTVELPMSDDEVGFYNIIDHLQQVGFDREDVKYWIVYSGRGALNFGGFGNLDADDDQALPNENNDNDPMYAVTFEPFRSGWDDRFAHTMLHEASHTMGAVQEGSPNFYINRGGWHCSDEDDVMCYGEDTRVVCSDGERYDCGKDDYFDPRPTAGTYLAEHWNLAHPYNRFLEGCMRAEGSLEAGIGGPVDVEVDGAYGPGVGGQVVEVPQGCHGAPFALWGQPQGLLGLTPPGQAAPLQVCWYAASVSEGTGVGPVFADELSLGGLPSVHQAIRCDQATRDEPYAATFTTTGEIPEGATSAHVSSMGAVSVGADLSFTLKAT